MLNILVKCLRPYLIDIKFKFNNYEKKIKNKIISTSVTNDFSYQDEIINFSFILDEKNKISFDENINIEITAKDPNNLIEEKILFKLDQNVIKLSAGNEMAKMIVGNALKNGLEFIENEKREIEFSTKYQILSKNTAIFTEIINKNGKIEKNYKKNEMTKVDLNEYKEDLECYRSKINKITHNYAHIPRRDSANYFHESFSQSPSKLILAGPIISPEYLVGGIPKVIDDIPLAKKNDISIEQKIKVEHKKEEKEKDKKEKEKDNNVINNAGNYLCLGLNILFYYLLLLILF